MGSIHKRRWISAVPLGVSAALVLTACGSSGDANVTQAQSNTSPAAAPAAAAPAAPAAPVTATSSGSSTEAAVTSAHTSTSLEIAGRRVLGGG
jgi:hypothetical protein